jgi:hypothetical protein
MWVAARLPERVDKAADEGVSEGTHPCCTLVIVDLCLLLDMGRERKLARGSA